MILAWWVKPLAALALAAAAVGGFAWWRASLKEEGARAERQRIEALADLQREANRGRARDAETRYSRQATTRAKFIDTNAKEVRHATENLAACPVLPAARSMLDRAVECASEDRPAACGPDDAVL